MKTGKYIPLSNDRRLVCDVIDIARRMPLAPVEQTIDVSEISKIRREMPMRISWQVIMMRAYALVSRDTPALRRVYVPFPWPRLYEHHESVCLLTFSRRHLGRERLFFARFSQPENLSLIKLQEMFDDYRRLPVRQIRSLNHQHRFASLPRPIRKIGWGLMTHWMPASRARQMGTFGMSLSRLRAVKGTWHMGPCTTTLGYDQLCRKGKAHVTLTFDHRILDGKPAFDAIERFESVLKNQITREMQGIVATNPDNLPGAVPAPELRIFDPEHAAAHGENEDMESVIKSAA